MNREREQDDWLAVEPEGNWGKTFPLTSEQWYLQIKDRIPVAFNEHARICFVAANYEHYCRNFAAAPVDPRLLLKLRDLVVELQKHSNDHIHGESEIKRTAAAVEGVIADRLNALLAQPAPDALVEPMPKFKGATCKGSFLLGSACGHCERCAWERSRIAPTPVSQAREAELFDLVQETRQQLQPYLRIETFPTGGQPANYLAVDVILQAALTAAEQRAREAERLKLANERRYSREEFLLGVKDSAIDAREKALEEVKAIYDKGGTSQKVYEWLSAALATPSGAAQGGTKK